MCHHESGVSQGNESDIPVPAVCQKPEKLPERIYEVKVGFYDPANPEMKYFLEHAVENVRKKTVARVRISSMMKVRHTNGWLTKSPVEAWRWAGPESGIAVTNVKNNTFFHLRGFTNGACFIDPPLLNLEFNGIAVDEIAFVNDRFDTWMVITDEMIKTDGSLDVDFKMNGAYIPEDCGINTDPRELSVAIYPPELTSFQFQDGFFPPESEGMNSWRWMGKQGNIEIVHPGMPARLAMELWTSFDRLEVDPVVTLMINDVNLTRFTVTHHSPTMLVDLNELTMGTSETFILTFKTDATFTAGDPDARKLGLMVKSIRLIPLGN